MGWHDVLDDIAYDWFAGDEDTRPPVSFGVRLERKLKRMPPADRIALARELLAGTGVGAVVLPDEWDAPCEYGTGWNDCRRAALSGMTP